MRYGALRAESSNSCTPIPRSSLVHLAGAEAPKDNKGKEPERGMVLPFEPLSMSFSHIWCAICRGLLLPEPLSCLPFVL